MSPNEPKLQTAPPTGRAIEGLMSLSQTRPTQGIKADEPHSRPPAKPPSNKSETAHFGPPAAPAEPHLQRGIPYTPMRDSHLPTLAQTWHTIVTLSRTKQA
jgi:hypothetical protein